MSTYYDYEGRPITSAEWGRLFEDNERRQLLREELTDSEGRDVTVSTVWLGLDHSFGQGPPLIFETMIFGGAHDEEMWRYSTEEQALEGHVAAVELVTRGKRWCTVEICIEYDPSDIKKVEGFVDAMFEAAHASEPDGLDAHVSSALDQPPPSWAQ